MYYTYYSNAMQERRHHLKVSCMQVMTNTIHCNRYQTNYSPCTPSSDGALHARVRALEADKADLERQVIILKHESATNAAAAATAGGGATPTGGRRDSTKYNRCHTSRLLLLLHKLTLLLRLLSGVTIKRLRDKILSLQEDLAARYTKPHPACMYAV